MKASGRVSAKRELRSSRKAPRENINRRSFSKTAQRVAKVRQPKVKLGNIQQSALVAVENAEMV